VKLAVIVAGVALLGAAPAKTVKLGDNYFSPKALTVKAGTTITWKWPSFEQAGDVHDVKLSVGPKGVRKFHSEAASTDYSFKRKLTVPGTYKIVCTLHDDMKMTIRVKR
jgi:plastocyanin